MLASLTFFLHKICIPRKKIETFSRKLLDLSRVFCMNLYVVHHRALFQIHKSTYHHTHLEPCSFKNSLLSNSVFGRSVGAGFADSMRPRRRPTRFSFVASILASSARDTTIEVFRALSRNLNKVQC